MTAESAGQLRYNDVRQKSVHNTFQRSEGTADQFLYWRVRSMEIDVHHEDPLRNDMPAGEWSVHHDWYDPISTVAKLSQFLATMRGLHDLQPDHEVVTLFIDIKDPFPVSSRAKHGWKAFDRILERYLGDQLYRPADLLARTPDARTLRQAIDASGPGWPTLDELRGRFLIVLTGGPAELKNYATSDIAARKRAAFLSVPVDGPKHIPGDGDEIFYNLNGEKLMHLAHRVQDAGAVARTYYVNTPALWKQAKDAGVQHPATDKTNDRVDDWASTRSDHGFPFEHRDGTTIDGVEEAGDTCGIWAKSGDLWGDKDSFVFHHRRASAATIDATYDVAISGPNSHVEHFVKGAVMARATTAADSAYFAIVRPGQKHGLRVQYRRQRGGPTIVMTNEIGPAGFFGRDIDQDTIVHVRLIISDGGTTATAEASYDRRKWATIGSVSFTGRTGDRPLRLHGFGVSGHDQKGGVKYLFIPAAETKTPSFTRTSLIGDATGGWVDWQGTGRWRTDHFGRWKPSAPATDRDDQRR